MLDFQISILEKFRDNPTTLSPGEFDVVEGLIEEQIKHIDPTGRFVMRLSGLDLTHISSTINCLINGVTNRLLDLHHLLNHLTDSKKQQVESGQLTDFGLNPRNPKNFKTYIGTKEITAMPLTKEQYNYFRGYKNPVNEDPKEKGYLVQYLDGGKPNHPDIPNYVSWSPVHVFDKAYKTNGDLTYGAALVLLKKGERLMRHGWNGRNMFIQLMPSRVVSLIVNGTQMDIEQGEHTVIVYPGIKKMHIWVPSPTDHLAEDWSVFTEED